MWNRLLATSKTKAEQNAKLERALIDQKEAHDKLKQVLDRLNEAGKRVDRSAGEVFSGND